MMYRIARALPLAFLIHIDPDKSVYPDKYLCNAFIKNTHKICFHREIRNSIIFVIARNVSI